MSAITRKESLLRDVLERHLDEHERLKNFVLAYDARIVGLQLGIARGSILLFVVLLLFAPESYWNTAGIVIVALFGVVVIPSALLLRMRYVLALTNRRFLLLRLPPGLRWARPGKRSDVHQWPKKSPPRTDADFKRYHAILRVFEKDGEKDGENHRPISLRIEYKLFGEPGAGRERMEDILAAAKRKAA